MKLIKGFCSINRFIKNTPGVVSPIGELSTWSMTYSKDKGEYEDPTIPGYKLITFKTVDTTDNHKIILSVSDINKIITFIKNIVIYADANVRPYDEVDFKTTLLVNENGYISNFTFGEFIDGGTLSLPEWISYTSTDGTTICKIWLSDNSFRNQYDDYSISIVPPFFTMNSFFRPFNQVVASLESRSPSDLSDNIQTVKGNNPETYLRLMSFDIINSNDETIKYSTTWGVIIYGIAGDNIDSIKDAIINLLLTGNTHTEQEWSALFPDIFARTEFILLPRWDKISIPNLTPDSALYSSILNLKEANDFAANAIDFYTDTFVRLNTNILFSIYKSIAIIVVNGFTNVIDKRKITDVFGDYIPISNTSPDFSRMSLETQEWAVILEELLMIAESPNFYSRLNADYRAVTRNNMLFVSRYVNNVNYLVAAKTNAIYG